MQRNPARPAGGLGGWKYQRHQSEKTLLYQIIAQHYSTRQAEWGLITWVRHPCLAVHANTGENQPDFPPESLLKDKQEAECQDQRLPAHGQQGAYSSYTPSGSGFPCPKSSCRMRK